MTEMPITRCKVQIPATHDVMAATAKGHTFAEFLRSVATQRGVPPNVEPTSEPYKVGDFEIGQMFTYQWYAVTKMPRGNPCPVGSGYDFEWPDGTRVWTDNSGAKRLQLVGFGHLSAELAERIALELLAAAAIARGFNEKDTEES